jgi:anti-sigma B factor antagonist
METAIGVFSSRERAEQAVRELLEKNVPQQAIVYLTRSELEAKTIGKQFGATVGGFMGGAVGMSTGVLAATVLLPGLGPVFALGFGAAALLGLTGAGAGATLGKAVMDDSTALQPTPDEKCPEDAAFFRDVLKGGRSLVVVRTEDQQIARTSSDILDRMGIAIQGATPVPLQASTRQIGDIAIVDIGGRITAGEGNLVLRTIVRNLMDKGTKRILLNLHDVGYVDSSGLGELVGTYGSVRREGGQLKLVNPSQRVRDLLQTTHLAALFDIQADEASAIQSFRAQTSEAVA